MITKNENVLSIDSSVFGLSLFWYDDEDETVEKGSVESIIYDCDGSLTAMILGEEKLLMEVSWDLLAGSPEECMQSYLTSTDDNVRERAEEALANFKAKELHSEEDENDS